jgi:hypothetical protein
MFVTKNCVRLSVVFALIFFIQSGVVQAACGPNLQPCACAPSGCIPDTSICILEPLPGGVCEITSGNIGLESFGTYVNRGVWQWAFRIGVAIAILNGVIAGFQITMSNGDSGKVDQGKTRFISSALGLLMLLLAGVILNFINPLGFSPL